MRLPSGLQLLFATPFVVVLGYALMRSSVGPVVCTVLTLLVMIAPTAVRLTSWLSGEGTPEPRRLQPLVRFPEPSIDEDEVHTLIIALRSALGAPATHDPTELMLWLAEVVDGRTPLHYARGHTAARDRSAEASHALVVALGDRARSIRESAGLRTRVDGVRVVCIALVAAAGDVAPTECTRLADARALLGALARRPDHAAVSIAWLPGAVDDAFSSAQVAELFPELRLLG